MKMFCVKLRTLLIIFGVLYFSEGKACPEKTRPHKTRCELYYKCMELPTKNHVWVPEKCEKGLVYVHNLKICALPGDDWECNLDDAQIQQFQNKKVNTSTNNEDNFKHTFKKSSNRDSDIYIVTNEIQESNFMNRLDDGNVEVILRSTIGNDEGNNEDVEPYESSGDGIDFSDGFLQASNKEATYNKEERQEMNLPIEEDMASHQETSTAKVDPSLIAHLQRLSQLIDGLKQTYQNRDKEQEDLTPDQLNAFLAHFNIKNKFDTLNLVQTHDNDEENALSSTTTSMPSNFMNTSYDRDSAKLSINATKLYEHFGHQLKPETKVVLTSSLPKRFASTGFSNSQIVVNRPEGSVLFSLPPYAKEDHYIEHEIQNNHNSPKISEETLKTVLELSKQMIATQNIPKVIPNPTYYAQPIIQPVFLPPSSYDPSGSSSINSPFSSYYNNPSSNINGDHNSGYNRPSTSNYNKPNYGHKSPNRPQNGYDGKPGTTIINNNVIPVHVTSTSSSEKDIIDSYGQSLGLYPPFSSSNIENSNSDYKFQVNHQYENNKFVPTIRPYISTTSSNQYVSGQFPSSYDVTVTTMRPPLEYRPSANPVSQYSHLSESNVNRYPTLQYGNIPSPINSNRPDASANTYQQLERPSSSYQEFNKHSLYLTQIDPNKVSIYPNSEKFESMETEDHLASLNNYDNSRPPKINTMQYNSEQDKPSSLLSGYNFNSNNNKNPYLPRPHQSNYGNGFLHSPSKPKFPSHSDASQLVNIGGNFISYDVFQNTILPLIGHSTGNSNADLANFEVINCQAGIRQPNVTDCTRYYVCSKKDGKVLSYSCPPYTAFNGQTRICDARTYANCAPDAILSGFTINENKRIQMEAMQALNEAKKRHEEALKAQKLSNLLQHYNVQMPNAGQPVYTTQNNFQEGSNGNTDDLNIYVQQAAALSASASITSTSKPPKKFKYYCKEGDKVPDQNSIYNYFVCYKNAQGMMKGHKLTCSKGLLFCSKTKMCTLPSKCT